MGFFYLEKRAKKQGWHRCATVFCKVGTDTACTKTDRADKVKTVIRENECG